MAAYYNEFDPFAAAWLRALIAAGHIAPGEVDERSILEVRPDDLRGFTQCHFFAGIGVWSYALRCAGWPDSRPVWTGSCPCQPFSSAGKGNEFADERHLWPAFFRLIRECRPVACFGEQVASKDALAWIDHVSTDMEGAGYTFGAVDTCAAGFGAPHIRQRLYFVADSHKRGRACLGEARLHDHRESGDDATGRCSDLDVGNSEGGGRGILGHAACPRDGGHPDRPEFAGVALGDAEFPRLEGFAGNGHDWHGPGWIGAVAAGSTPAAGQSDDRVAQGDAEQRGCEELRRDGNKQPQDAAGRCPAGAAVTLGDADRIGASHGEIQRGGKLGRASEDAVSSAAVGLADASSIGRQPSAALSRIDATRMGSSESVAKLGSFSGATNGFWSSAEWIACRDGKARPVEPGTSPLAHGAPNRVGRLRGYGNAICAPQAQEFVRAFMECTA